MPFVVTVDQRASRRSPDRVAGVLPRLNGHVPVVLAFERTAGDEFQGLLADPAAVVDAVLLLVREGGWSIGVGAGAVHAPLPRSARAGSGPAYLAARRAVDAAKQRPTGVAVRGAVPVDAGDAQAVLGALALLVDRRSPQAWEAIERVAAGATQAEAAAALGVSRQAVGQRLAAAHWELERELRPTAARLLDRAAG
ncbi:SatD family protein [Geodermatophilus sp. YIM 151500]|uniref:SatD family protein n=1 Tax=Geodermatophilus sp. YIM 151500 TaxID=2984531 RepID=UPI0021E423C8|nr:SatD family protein [Geodermatophilus sp. YIM 151500]MCV2487935.1 SatD family protein [Geodermatophilus sp. YIM 151500]